MAHHAGCLCGQVRIAIDAEPMAARQCWCRLCQYLGGGTGPVNVCFPSDKIAVTGKVRWHESIADSGNKMERGFCPECGTPLFSRTEARLHLTFIRAGALDDPDLLGPQAVIWTDAAPAWAHLDPDLPHHPTQMPPVA